MQGHCRISDSYTVSACFEERGGLHRGPHGNTVEGRPAETRRRKRIMTMTSDAQSAIVNEIDADADQDRHMLPIHRSFVDSW